MKKYRFFYHYFKRKKKMSVHFKNSCMVVQNVICLVPCETKWRKTQPRIVMQGFASRVRFLKDTAIIS